MANTGSNCGFCKQPIKLNSSAWVSGYGKVHKKCYETIKGNKSHSNRFSKNKRR
jgi:hypothetical protein